MTEADDPKYTRMRSDTLPTNHLHTKGRDLAHGQQKSLMKLCYKNYEDDDELLEELDEILSQNVDVNSVDAFGRTALIHASIAQNYIVIDALLYLDDTAIDVVDKDGETALTYAIKADDHVMVCKLVHHPKATKSKLLSLKTRGKTALDLAIQIANPEIISALKSASMGTESEAKDLLQMSARADLAPIQVPKVAHGRSTHIFMTAKSHSDTLLLSNRRKQNRELLSEKENLADPLSLHCRNAFNGAENEGQAQLLNPDTDNRCGTLPLLPRPKSSNLETCELNATAHQSRRRGSISLPDLTSLPNILGNVCLEENESESESNDHEGDDESTVDSDEDCETNEQRKIMAAQNRRKNSISLPDLCLQHIPKGRTNRKTEYASGLPQLPLDNLGIHSSNENNSFSQCGQTGSQLKLPDIHLCNSPSLPSLDRLTLRKIKWHKTKSTHNLQSTVRQTFDGESENFSQFLARKKDTSLLPSFT